MASEREDWQYTSGDYLNPSGQPGLEKLFVDLVTKSGPRLRVCDLGCGNGRLAWTLAALGHCVVGVDSSASGIDIARSTNLPGEATFIRAQIEHDLPQTLRNAHDLFDVVVSSDVIEHLYRPATLLAAARDILRPKGVLIVSTPYHGYLKNLGLSILDKWDWHHGVHWDGGHIKFFSVRSLGAMVRGAGFSNLQFSFYGRAPFLWKSMVCSAERPD